MAAQPQKPKQRTPTAARRRIELARRVLASRLRWRWREVARPEQLAPEGDWSTWLLMAGRGFGKTRTGAEWVREQVEQGLANRIALVAPTSSDARDVMIEGESGIMAICPPWNRPKYEPSKRRLTWPSGAMAIAYSADEPDRLRGPQHDALWADELAAWTRPEAWDMARFGLRLGRSRAVVTTTPRPIKILRDLLADEATAVTHGSTYDNRANLAETFFASIVSRYEGTRLGRQELLAELLTEAEGALWNRDMLDGSRVDVAPEMVRIVVGVDPAMTNTADSDETGVVVVGLGENGEGYVLSDVSGRMTPDQVAQRAIGAYELHEADRIIGEVNNGGDWIESVIRSHDAMVSYKAIRASKGKAARAEPVAALYEQNRIHHVGTFNDLEDQLCTWEPQGSGRSPDRLDALVWAITELLVKERGEMREFRFTGF